MAARFVLVLVLAWGVGGCALLHDHSPVELVPGAHVPAGASGSRISTQVRIARPPPAFLDFCKRLPEQCVTPSDEQTLQFSDESWNSLQQVNAAVNWVVAPLADQLHFGAEEYWTIATDGYGDCDDYVLTKRKALIEMGFPLSALRIAVVFTPRLERHTVLVVATDKGHYVLDNRRNEIVTWDKTDYGWIKGQNPASSTGWAYF
jgi:predicted transglutaminase-like cysteine proteinase